MSQAAVDALIALLDLEPIEVNIFRGVSPPAERQRVFGGQVAGQALVAAARTVEPDAGSTRCTPTSCAPATPASRSSTRSTASATAGRSPPAGWSRVQHGQAIFNLSASFQVPEDGFEHQEPMPEVPAPETLPDLAERWEELAEEGDRLADKAEGEFTLDLPHRHSATATGRSPTASGPLPPYQRVWLRADG